MDEYLAVIRFFHIIAGITWIGLLYYFNLVQVPSFAKMDPAARSNAVQVLVPRALAWFRYTALATVAMGILWIVVEAVDLGWGVYFDADYIPMKSIAIGGGLGIIMFANVWLIIWPNQKKVIAATTETAQKQTPAPPDQPKWARTAFLASRTNVMLSIPMLFFMIVAAHLPRLWV